VVLVNILWYCFFINIISSNSKLINSKCFLSCHCQTGMTPMFYLWTGFAQVLENRESPGILKFGFQVWNFVEVLESPGIWTHRSIFLIISIQEFSHYTSSKIWVYLCMLKVREFIEKVLEFDIGRSWNLRCQNVYEPW